MINKRSIAELTRLVEAAVEKVCELDKSRYWFCVGNVSLVGKPLALLNVFATLHFLSNDKPFCCFEPQCHLGLFEKRLDDVVDYLRKSLCIQQSLSIDFNINPQIHKGATIRAEVQEAQE